MCDNLPEALRFAGRFVLLSTREQIAVAIGANAGTGRTVDKTVERLRRAINKGSLPDPIRSVPGAGYKFSPAPDLLPRRRRHAEVRGKLRLSS